MKATTNQTFSQFLKAKREAVEITQKDLAELSGVSLPYISMMERLPDKLPSNDKLEQLCQALDIDFNEALEVVRNSKPEKAGKAGKKAAKAAVTAAPETQDASDEGQADANEAVQADAAPEKVEVETVDVPETVEEQIVEQQLVDAKPAVESAVINQPKLAVEKVEISSEDVNWAFNSMLRDPVFTKSDALKVKLIELYQQETGKQLV